MTVTFLKLGVLAAVGALFSPLSPPTFSNERIERVGTLRVARSAHTATALQSGQVLFAGGMTSGGGALNSSELFDPADNSVRDADSMLHRRLGHTATLLADGRVLVAGGNDGTTVEMFDPRTMRFREAGHLEQPRSGHTATLLSDGRILLAGGIGPGWTFLRSAELFDPRKGRSEPVGPMLRPRESHTATLLEDGRVLITGGHSGRRAQMEVYASTEVFDPRARKFQPGGNLITARHKHDAVRLTDGRVLIIAGADRTDRNHFNSTEIYDPAAGRSEAGPSLAHRRYKISGTSIVLPNGDVLVTSGAPSAEILDADTQKFREVRGPLARAYRFATAASLPNGDVLVSGGYDDGNDNTAGIWRFRAR